MPRLVHHVTAAALVAALVFHFSATGLYLTPPNAIALRARPAVDRYMTPYFAQAWTLFAPDPIVDTRETGTKSTFDLETMQNIPSARDPWVMLEKTPGIVMDRANVGGNQSGQQSTFISRVFSRKRAMKRS